MVAINEVANLTNEGEVALLTLDSPPVNALSVALRRGLLDGFVRAIADPSISAIVLLCAGRTSSPAPTSRNSKAACRSPASPT